MGLDFFDFLDIAKGAVNLIKEIRNEDNDSSINTSSQDITDQALEIIENVLDTITGFFD